VGIWRKTGDEIAGTARIKRMLRRLTFVVIAAVVAAQGAKLRYWIAPCPEKEETGCQASDADLAQWALEAWQAASDGALVLERSAKMENAHIRLYWVSGRSGLYGEARTITVEGIRGAEVYVLPAVARSDDRDPFLRDAIVYLTCLHETGHALGMPHTAEFADIMYSFQYGGDITEYFARYRRQLTARGDIRKHSGISPADRKKLLALWR
jgi:hypothetical protein